DGARHGRRDQHRLTAGRQHVDDLLDVGQEAQVEHLVGLVEDERLDVLEVELLLAREVQQPARGADDDVDALLEGLDLRLVGTAAVDGEDAYVTDLARGQQVVGHLRAQLARRDDDEGLRGVGELLGLGAARLDVGGDGGERGGRVGTVPGTSAALDGRAEWHGTTADARALVPLRVPPYRQYARCRTDEEGCRVGADRATDRASSFVRPVEYSPGALPPYPG